MIFSIYFLPHLLNDTNILEIQIIAGIILLVMWIPIEAVLLSTAGNTPAKWLFGISVRTKSGHKPSFSQALERSFRVVLQGEGLGIPFVVLFTNLFAYRRLTKSGTTLWDTATQCVVAHKTWGVARTISCVVVVLLVFILLGTMGSMQFTAKQNAFDLIEREQQESPRAAPAPVRATGRDARFISYDAGTVLDRRTNLMWAAKDNGKDINWANAKSYCENYRGGGYMDWRLPTQEELAGLFDPRISRKAACNRSYDIYVATELIDITCFAPWASETRGSDAAAFHFSSGSRLWNYQSVDARNRALPVRSGK